MRFGVMTIQLSELLPQGANPEEMRGTLGGFSHAAMVRKLGALGFNPIELSGDLGMFLPQAFNPQAINAMAALKAEISVGYTVHLPLWSVETSTPLTPVRHGSVRAVIENILATRPLDPEVYVLHATGALAAEFYQMHLPDIARTYLLQQFQKGALDSVQTILQETGIPSRKLAVETIEFPFALTLEIAEQLDLSLCLDVGHILSGFSGPLDLYDVVNQCLPRLAEVHLHDAVDVAAKGQVVYGQDHQTLGTRDLDTARFLDVLASAGYTGPIILELPVSQALASMDVIRQLRPAYVEG
jgi:sugar phosphate isomerase/epimerase